VGLLNGTGKEGCHVQLNIWCHAAVGPAELPKEIKVGAKGGHWDRQGSAKS